MNIVLFAAATTVAGIALWVGLGYVLAQARKRKQQAERKAEFAWEKAAAAKLKF